jgi:hypothetical protein
MEDPLETVSMLKLADPLTRPETLWRTQNSLRTEEPLQTASMLLLADPLMRPETP